MPPTTTASSGDMSKLSASLKALISAPHARGSPLPTPPPGVMSSVFDRLSSSADKHGLGYPTWLTLSTAALVTLNSPATLCALYDYSTKGQKLEESVERASIMREAGLKTISFSGIPRTINSLGALREHLPKDVASALSTAPTRQPTPSNVSEIVGPRADSLWESIYQPHSAKLLDRLTASHPDLPVHILASHYGALLADPPEASEHPGKVGRVLTSVIAVAALRAQEGVEPQVISHVFGLKKAAGSLPDGVEGEEFLTSNEGSEWVLSQVDAIVAAVRGANTRAKL